MKKKTFYEPDYHLLNREAKAQQAPTGERQPGTIMDRLLPNNNKPEPIEKNPGLFRELSGLTKEIKEQVDWEQDLMKTSYVVFDTETTGLRPFRGDEIISLGAVILEHGQILKQPVFYRLVNPRRPVSAKSEKITGINDEMLQDKPQILPVILDFLKFCGPRILVAHNAPFDIAFINLKLGQATGDRIVNPVLDTVLLTSALYYHLEDYSLENLSSRFGFSLEGRHNALSDARITASLFLKLLKELKAREITTLPRLAHLFSELDLTRAYPLIF